MSIYHQFHHQHSCSRAIQPDRKDTMVPPTDRQSAVPCRHLHDAVGACPQDGSCVYICCSIGEDTPSHFPSSHRLRTTIRRTAVSSTSLSCCLAQREGVSSPRSPNNFSSSAGQVCLIAGLGTILSSPVPTLITSLFIVVLTLSLYRQLSAQDLDFTLFATRQVSIGPVVQT